MQHAKTQQTKMITAKHTQYSLLSTIHEYIITYIHAIVFLCYKGFERINRLWVALMRAQSSCLVFTLGPDDRPVPVVVLGLADGGLGLADGGLGLGFSLGLGLASDSERRKVTSWIYRRQDVNIN